MGCDTFLCLVTKNMWICTACLWNESFIWGQPQASILEGLELKIAKMSWGPSRIPKMPLIKYMEKCFDTTSCQFFMNLIFVVLKRTYTLWTALHLFTKATNLHWRFNKAKIPGSSKKTTTHTYTVKGSCSRPPAPNSMLGTAGVHDGLQKEQPF